MDRWSNLSAVGTRPPATATPLGPRIGSNAEMGPRDPGALTRSATPEGFHRDAGPVHRIQVPLHDMMRLHQEHTGHRHLGVVRTP
jgi:hypothetical protein